MENGVDACCVRKRVRRCELSSLCDLLCVCLFAVGGDAGSVVSRK